MQRTTLQSVTFAIALSLLTTSAHAWPLGRMFHLHPDAASAKDARVYFGLYNKSGIIQDVTIGDQKYSLMPNSGMTVTAPTGTEVISQTIGPGRKKGDLLLTVQPTLRNDTVLIR